MALSKLVSKAPAPQAPTPHAPAVAAPAAPAGAAAVLVMSRPKRVLEVEPELKADAEGFAKAADVDCDLDRDRGRDDLDRLAQRAERVYVALTWIDVDTIVSIEK